MIPIEKIPKKYHPILKEIMEYRKLGETILVADILMYTLKMWHSHKQQCHYVHSYSPRVHIDSVCGYMWPTEKMLIVAISAVHDRDRKDYSNLTYQFARWLVTQKDPMRLPISCHSELSGLWNE